MRSAASKIVSLAEASRFVRDVHGEGGTVVLANGVFDLLHVGHARYLAAAKAAGTHLVVGVNADRSAAELKGAGHPVLGELERARLIAALRAVDRVVIFAERSADTLLDALRPDLHAKGTDYRPDTVPERATMATLGGRTVVTGDAKTHASRDLFALVRSRYAGRS